MLFLALIQTYTLYNRPNIGLEDPSVAVRVRVNPGDSVDESLNAMFGTCSALYTAPQN